MNGSNLLYNFAFFLLGGLIVYALKPFLGSYSAKKGENLATKEDIAQITKVQEDIKAQISDEKWDRQKQWEMKRDAISDVVRAIHPLTSALEGLVTLHLVHPDPNTATRRDETPDERKARENFVLCLENFECARFLATLFVGDALRTALSECYTAYRTECATVMQERLSYYSTHMEARVQKVNTVFKAAREELNIENNGHVAAVN
jgi:hypothetical protein